MSVPSFSHGRDVTLRRQALTGTDAYGNDVRGPAETTVSGCAVWSTASTEQTVEQDLVSITVTILFPPGTSVLATDTVLLDGQEYQIMGQPYDWSRHPMTNSRAGIEARVQRVTG